MLVTNNLVENQPVRSIFEDDEPSNPLINPKSSKDQKKLITQSRTIIKNEIDETTEDHNRIPSSSRNKAADNEYLNKRRPTTSNERNASDNK